VEGWNWWSTNLDITLNDLKAALVATGNTSITIKSKSQTTYYQNGRWRGNLTFHVEQMYEISVGNSCEIVLTGDPLNPAEHPISIVKGKNWIGFPLNQTMTPAQAFAGFATNGDVIKSKNGNTARYTGGRWRGSCDLVPGQGYQYESTVNDERTFVFPTVSRRAVEAPTKPEVSTALVKKPRTEEMFPTKH
jgi:hypothetical protein